MKKHLLLAFALLSSPVAAAPAYLSCKIPDQPDYEIQVTADEDAGFVTTLVVSTGFSQRLPAAFSPTEVRFGDRLMTFRVDRTTLDFDRTIYLLKETSRGKCTVLKARKRAF